MSTSDVEFRVYTASDSLDPPGGRAPGEKERDPSRRKRVRDPYSKDGNLEYYPYAIRVVRARSCEASLSLSLSRSLCGMMGVGIESHLP